MRKVKWCVGFVMVLLAMLTTAVVAQAMDDPRQEQFTLRVDTAGYYYITVNYAAVRGSGEILLELQVNGRPVPGAHALPFARFFVDASDDWRYMTGNQNHPSQIEVERYTDFTLTVSPGRRLPVWLNAGDNTLLFIVQE